VEPKIKKFKEKGTANIAELKIKIADEKYMKTAITSMATHISRVFFSR